MEGFLIVVGIVAAYIAYQHGKDVGRGEERARLQERRAWRRDTNREYKAKRTAENHRTYRDLTASPFRSRAFVEPGPTSFAEAGGELCTDECGDCASDGCIHHHPRPLIDEELRSG